MTETMKQYPVGSFFALTFAISWLIWIPLAKPVDRLFGEWVGIAWLEFGTYGPGLAAMMLSRILLPEKRASRPKAFWMTFGVTWLVAFGSVVLLRYLFGEGNVKPYAVSSLAAAFVMAHAFSRVRGVQQLLHALIRPPGGVGIHLVAVTFIPTSYVFAMVLRQFGGQEPDWRLFAERNGFEIVIICLVFIVNQVFHNNMLGEEVGWRGFALRHTQIGHSPLRASLSIGLLWWLWHLPIWSVMHGGFKPELVMVLFLLIMPISMIHTWIFNRSGGSIWAVGLLHASADMSWKLLPNNLVISIPVLLCLATVLLCLDKMWLRIPCEFRPDAFHNSGNNPTRPTGG